MAATTTSETYDALWTLTMRAKRKRLTDNISDAYPTIAEFRKAGMIETENGGKQIAEDLMYALASSEFFDTYDVLNTDSIDGITQAHYDWSYMATPIVISMTEERENRASDKAIKLLEAKTTQAMQGALDQANQTALSAATGKAFLGLQDICAESTGATVGGINSTNETWWESQRFDFDATHTSFDTKVGDSYEGVLGMSALWNDLTEGNEQPNLIITEYEVYEDYENIFESGLYLRTTPGSRNNVDGRNPAYRGAKVKIGRAHV